MVTAYLASSIMYYGIFIAFYPALSTPTVPISPIKTAMDANMDIIFILEIVSLPIFGA